MSGYKGHIIGAVILLVIAFLVAYFTGFITLADVTNETIYYGLLILVFFSILPDIDITSSMISKLFMMAVGGFSIYLIYLYFTTNYDYALYLAIILMVLLIFRFFLKHRGLFHSIFMGLILSAPFLILYFSSESLVYLIWFAFALTGYISHLLFDLA